MNKRLSELITEGVTIITPTQRLSRHLRYLFATDQLAQGNQVWESPDCLPWTAWCKRSFESLSLRSDDKYFLLNTLQQQWLWQEIISSSKYKGQLLQIPATAKQALQAYRLCKEWCLPVFPEGTWLSEDALAFRGWTESYEKQKIDNHWVDDACLPDHILTHVADFGELPKKIVLYDFDKLTTQQLNLKQVLVKQGINVEILEVTSRNETISISEQTDKQSEICAAAVWAKGHLESNVTATIGIVTPNLSALRDNIEYGFATVLTPHKWNNIENAIDKPYSISLGTSLSSYPLIQIAINLLSLGRRKVTINTLSTILHSPFIQGADEESAARAKFDAALRQLGERHMGFKTLYWMAEEHCKLHEQCTQFIQLLKSFEISYLSHAKKQPLRQWALNFSEWLTGFGWPGERSLNSDEHQQITAWQTALTQLGSLDGITQPVNFSTALFYLNRLLIETHFQPETIETPIQIIGMTGAAGMQFDYLWVMDMQDDTWPELKTANAFIPQACQRDFSIPTASADAQLLLAKKITDKLIASAQEVVFSYANQSGDRVCRPSPLINIEGSKLYSDSERYIDYKNIIFESANIETLIDVDGPEIPIGKIANGGSSLFKDQAGCPFKAFARHRLYAESLRQTDIGLSAAERGTLVHRALHYLWQRIKTSENLQYRSESELIKIIHSVVQEAIKQQVSQQPETFTDRFTELEQLRLEQLLKQWLQIESDRNDFKVIATEEWQTILFEDIELHLRVDRIDELADGRCVIIDYKTGVASKNDWESENPNDPQMPLYAVTSKQEVAAIAFASLKRGKLGFSGQADGDDILPGIKEDTDYIWQDRFESWEQVLIQLADDFRKGKAIVEPTTTACRYCDLHSLCRIHERIDNQIDDDPQERGHR